MNKKNQHWVPACYLDAWCDPKTPTNKEPYVWQFSKSKKEFKSKAPKKICKEANFYTRYNQDGSRDLSLEDKLGDLESFYAPLRENKIKKKKPLSYEEAFMLKVFVAAMRCRTRKVRNQTKSQYQEIADKLVNFNKKSPNFRNATFISSGGPTISLSEIKEMAINPIPHTLLPNITQTVQLLMNMNLTFLCTSDETGFITSDAPCVWITPESRNIIGPPTKNIEISLPITPYIILLLTTVLDNQYNDVPIEIVDELNRREYLNCEEFIFVQSNITKTIWFAES